MVKNILGVVIGYVTMAVFIFATFSIAYLLLGTECSFQPNSYDVSMWWIVISIVLSIAGAILGGFVCAAIATSGAATKVLAGFVLVLGIALAIPTLSDNPDRLIVRDGDVGNMEAMQSAHQPTWLAFLTPLIGATGVMMGSCMKKKK